MEGSTAGMRYSRVRRPYPAPRGQNPLKLGIWMTYVSPWRRKLSSSNLHPGRRPVDGGWVVRGGSVRRRRGCGNMRVPLQEPTHFIPSSIDRGVIESCSPWCLSGSAVYIRILPSRQLPRSSPTNSYHWRLLQGRGASCVSPEECSASIAPSLTCPRVSKHVGTRFEHVTPIFHHLKGSITPRCQRQRI